MHKSEPFFLLAFATKGASSNEEIRLSTLLQNFTVELVPFDRQDKRRSFWKIMTTICRQRPDLTIMEGTGLAGGLAVLSGRLLYGIPYVVSSGDAVGPFVTARQPFLGPLFALYERLLCRFSAGFIGWTPYITGRALTFGAPRAMTAPGWAPFPPTPQALSAGRTRVRKHLGIPDHATVIGIVGSLVWTKRVGYCYGYELVLALNRTDRPDLYALIVGDGDGREHLEHLAGKQLGRRIFLTGQVPQDHVPEYLAAMDLASLPQSVDGVGSFRYTTKISEYLACGLPIVTGQIPFAYDMMGDWLWRLPGTAPWDKRYITALSELITHLTPAQLNAKRSAVPRELPEFDRARQVARVTAFLMDLLAERGCNVQRQ